MEDKLSQEIADFAEKLEKASQGPGSKGGQILRYTPAGKPVYAASNKESSGKEDDKEPAQAKVKVEGIGGKGRKNLQAMASRKAKQKAAVKEKVKELTKSEEGLEVKDTLKSIMSKIEEMGPEALKKATETMTEDQKILLSKILSKASIQPKPLKNDVDLEPKNVKDLNSHEIPKFMDGRNNEKDEKLVKPENDEVKHQGDNSPEAFEGQKIEDKEEQKGSAPADEKPMDNNPGDESSKMDREEAENFKRTSSLKKALKKIMKKLVKKAMKKQAMKPEVQGAEKEYGGKDAHEQFEKKYEGFDKLKNEIAREGSASDPAAVAASIGRKKYGKVAFQHAAEAGKKMKKSEKFEELYKSEDKMRAMCQRMHEKGMSKEAFLEKCGSMGWDVKKCSNMWPADKMKKAVVWNDWQTEYFSTNSKWGRNHCYNTSNDEIEAQEKSKKETLAKGGYINDFTAEGFKKSEGKLTINDLIEKKLDVSFDKIEQARQNLEFKKSFAPNYSKSFTDEDMVKSLGIDSKKADEIIKK